jgi:NAD(P)-dependent dehydrogenase (short-subunit alcohol dehydrogenase family)
MSTVSLVTGGNRGIGREACRQLTELGHVVLLTARSADAAAAAARAVHAESLPLDVTDPASIAPGSRVRPIPPPGVTPLVLSASLAPQASVLGLRAQGATATMSH